MSQYLLNLQRAISQTESTYPSQDIEYQIGWGDLVPDLLYAASLSETCVRGHINIWHQGVVDNENDQGYLDRIEAIKLIMESV